VQPKSREGFGPKAKERIRLQATKRGEDFLLGLQWWNAQKASCVAFFVKPFQVSVDGPQYVLHEIGETPVSLKAITNEARLCF